ncbi:MAG: two-component system sensor histidine kinase [Bacilli bacterium]|nr:two-component system sensor histidine kinase [Bacilli bacterium]
MASNYPFDPEQPTKNNEHISRLAAVGQIAAGIAHEVKNPLTTVKGFIQLLQENNPKDPKAYLDLAHTELDNALATLESLLQVSKPDLDDEPYQTVNLCVELESTLNLFQDQYYQVEIQKNFRNTDRMIVGRKNQLKKAFFNLIKNAFEAISDAGIISIEHYTDEHSIHVIIRDTGVGISEDKLPLIGTPFFTTKASGTGMGLSQVFSVIYQHGGSILVNSTENEGTTFELILPIESTKTIGSVNLLNLDYENGQNLQLFFTQNRNHFEQRLLEEAVQVKHKIDEIRETGNIDLMNNAYKLVNYIIEDREHEMIGFAKQEGVAWARHDLTLAFKLEWLQAIRRVLWDFLYNFERLSGANVKLEDFFGLEKRMNVLLDQFLNYFFISYSSFKDDLLKSQRVLIDDLSVPIIPISPSICILPLIGSIDAKRSQTIYEKVLSQIDPLTIETLIIDLSGIAHMQIGAIDQFLRMLDGIRLMGCKPILTGMRSDIVKLMLDQQVSLADKAETKRNLQQAIEAYLHTTNEINESVT